MQRFVLCVWLAVAAGCPDRSVSELPPIAEGTFTKEISTSDLDLLFVIDNSASTRDKQTVFAQNFLNFVAALDRFPTGRPNVHIGVVTSSVDIGVDGFGGACRGPGQDGRLQDQSRDPMFACAPPATDRFLSDVAMPGGGRLTNYAGQLDQAFACISHVGDGGCGFEAPLEAMKRALDGSRPENAGFLRRGSFLAVVVLTDEDDCSASPALFQTPASVAGQDDFRCAPAAYECDTPISPTAGGSYAGCRVRRNGALRDPASYAQFLASLKGAPRTALAVIAAPATDRITTGRLDAPFRQDLAVLPTTCSATINGRLAIGRPALRLDDVTRAFGVRGLFRTVCQPDYSEALDDIGQLLFTAVSPCLEGALDDRDTDPAAPGLQPDCAVSQVQDADTDHPVAQLLSRCEMTAPGQPDPAGEQPCWWVKDNPAACSTQTHLELHVERRTPPPPNTTVRVTCALAPR